MKHLQNSKSQLRARRHKRVRACITGSAERPRLAVFKSNRYISAQLIDDASGKTIAAAHGKAIGGAQGAQAAKVGTAIAEAAKKLKVKSAVFDRGGYKYTAQVKALAEAAREAGLAF